MLISPARLDFDLHTAAWKCAELLPNENCKQKDWKKKKQFSPFGKQTAYIALSFNLCQQFHCTLVIKQHYVYPASNSQTFQNCLSKIVTLGFPCSLLDGNWTSSKTLKGQLGRKFVQSEITNREIIFSSFIYNNHSLFSLSVANWFVPGFCICFHENVGMIHLLKLLPKRN